MNIPHPSRWDESSLYLLPILGAELKLQTERLLEGPADDVPLYDATQRINWLTGAIAHLRRIERRKQERLAAQASIRAEKVLRLALEILPQRRTLQPCADGDL
jgi:hypothetical protein